MSTSTQQSIPIAGIKDGIVILKNGGYRIILSVSTVNFALKSEQEQNSLIFQYQSFLNSLHFPIQIVIRSKRLDLTPYLQKVAKLASEQSNELLKIQTEDYVDFVSKLISLANIMKKTFYVSIPFEPLTLKKVSFIDKLLGKEKTIGILKISEEEFKHNSDELRQRANIVATGLGGMGLHCLQLNTEQIIELFYQIYNPEVAGEERLENAEILAAPVIQHTSEKKEPDNQAISMGNGEEVIDNTATVQATQQQQAALRQQEMLKEGTRQIKTTEAKKGVTSNTPQNEISVSNKDPEFVDSKSQAPNNKLQINSNIETQKADSDLPEKTTETDTTIPISITETLGQNVQTNPDQNNQSPNIAQQDPSAKL